MPMDESKVRSIVEANLPAMQGRFGLAGWRLVLKYGPCPSSATAAAEVSTNLDYQRAWVTVNPHTADDEADVIDSVRHELLHLVVSPYDLFFDHVAGGLVGAEAAQVRKLFVWSMEQSVLNMERMLDGIGTSG